MPKTCTQIWNLLRKAIGNYTLANSIKAELAVFENSGTKGLCQEQVYACLLSIPATSVEANGHFQRLGFLRQKCHHVSMIPRWTGSAFYVPHQQLAYRARKNSKKNVWAV